MEQLFVALPVAVASSARPSISTIMNNKRTKNTARHRLSSTAVIRFYARGLEHALLAVHRYL
eukprot:scaffold4387_cov32-Cyclotella_meneghiniana.AAC.1